MDDRPYRITCQKHGTHYSSIDECEKCLEEIDQEYYAHIPSSICWSCVFCDHEPKYSVNCHYNEKLSSLKQKPRKKHCKHYQENLQEYNPGENFNET